MPLLLVLACSTEPRDRTIPSDVSTWNSNAEFRNTVDALPSEDRKLVQNWMLRHAFEAGKSIPKRTIGEAIEEQRKYEAENKAKPAKPGAAAGGSEPAADGPAPAR